LPQATVPVIGLGDIDAIVDAMLAHAMAIEAVTEQR
jgi:hypothetical protein